MPKVSVIIPCYNAEGFVADAVECVLKQTLTDTEVIVVDDASTDGSREIVKALAERNHRVRPVFLPSNGGPSVARNAGLDVARGDFVALLDADDLYTADRLERLIAIAEESDADVVGDNQILRDFGQTTDVGNVFEFIKSGQRIELGKRTFFDKIWLGYNHYDLGLLKPIMRRSFLNENNIRYDVRYKIGEDLLLYMMTIVHGAKMVITGDSYYIYHRRVGSISRDGSKTFEMLADMVDDIIEDCSGVLDNYQVSKLKARKSGLLRVVYWRELRAHRVKSEWWKMAKYIIRRPVSLIELLSQNRQWRQRVRDGRHSL